MEAPAPGKAVRIWSWLPYWAVFREDIRLTLHSWVYRTWVLVCLCSAVGYLLYRRALYHEAGIVQNASNLVSDLLRWCVLGSVTLIIVLTAGSISSERGTMADSVLSRGISRYQYFLGKWHARLVSVLSTFLLIGLAALAGSIFLLHEDLSWTGSLVALFSVAAILGIVISCGVTMSAIFNSTLLGIAVLWLTVYGAGFALLLLPAHYPSPYRVLNSLPYILRGEYNYAVLGRLIGWAGLVSCLAALPGLGYFSRRDV
jgi:ABC-type transport system involved in multi-copper enzyme maturation permease subunit